MIVRTKVEKLSIEEEEEDKKPSNDQEQELSDKITEKNRKPNR
jgi:hypothetical protein